MFNTFFWLITQVPVSWSKCYPSLKPLGAWMRDLIVRAEQIRDWAMVAMPKVFWLPGMTYPTGEQTAVRALNLSQCTYSEYVGQSETTLRVHVHIYI